MQMFTGIFVGPFFIRQIQAQFGGYQHLINAIMQLSGKRPALHNLKGYRAMRQILQALIGQLGGMNINNNNDDDDQREGNGQQYRRCEKGTAYIGIHFILQ